ncbi:GntR family transcriptional regulator [Propionispora vibrioides]|uniref:GntR family transcriptional regulator n=1 Tax=Propionispora vibrioides TaxID=112903 RepID=A0A1H8VHQ8_9FIRM|nr:GntR family transcriptional regulator [Propionispora vibrioides]SEP14834.1 GntR family transcriptional regulator [Propionispora vibrioides]
MVKYQQIANDIRNKITSGEYVPGVQLALEKEMCEYYGVSRITIKRAVDELVNLGLVVKRRGSGTFVKTVENQDVKELSMAKQFTGFTETNRGQKVQTEVIRFDIVHPSQEVASKLQITEDDFVYDIIRARSNDEGPIVVEYTKMPIQLIPGLKKEHVETSIYAYIQDKLQLKIQSAHRTLRAVMPTELEVKHLHIEGLLPLLEIEQVAFFDDGRPFEYSISRHRADRIAFKTVSIR